MDQHSAALAGSDNDTDDDNVQNNTDPSSIPSGWANAPFAPSDFLKHLPPSTDTPGGAYTGESTSGESHDISTGRESTTGPPNPRGDAPGRILNPRSCVTCRKRKVKCDKTHPCANCNRAHIECVFPAPGRAPRKKRKLVEGKDKELLERLRRLEGVVKGLGVDVPDGQSTGVGDTAKDPENHSPSRNPAAREEKTIEKEDANGHGDDQLRSDGQFNAKTRWIEEQRQGRFENRFGRLVINEGRSRYINNSFWASLSNEVEDLKGILNQSSDEDDVASPGSNPGAENIHQGWMFGYSSQTMDMLSLHPLPSQIALYWETYKDRVDPLCKVLHIPTLQHAVLSAASHLSSLSKGFETLMFAIYYGAATSLSAEDCVAKFGEERSVLLSRYRFAVEQALARANFLTTEEAIVLQSFVIFLICLRRNSDARVIWTLTGLVVRIAQTIGIHRDGTHFALPPFETEMRRRLWWQVCILDTRASEDHGCDPTIIEQSFDTQMPLNVNDVDIWPDMKTFPPERAGCTDISFCLIRFEVANTFRRINYVPPGPSRPNPEYYNVVTLHDKEKWITDCHLRLEQRYLKHCDMSVPIYWVTATVARLMMSKMWLMVYHPFQRQDGGASLPAETKDKLFITSLENIEYSVLLETEARTMKWGWLFRTYMQWHALAFMLSELCRRTEGEIVDRAWVAVDKVCDRRFHASIADNGKAGHLWRPLQRLYRKAKEARARGTQDEPDLLQTSTDPQLSSVRRYSPNAHPMFEKLARPRMVRAPLSQAQLQRFAQGPEFGQMPLDKHELLKSPKPLEGLTGSTINEMDPMDTTESSSLDPPRPTMFEGVLLPTRGTADYPISNSPGQPGFGQVGPILNLSFGMSSADSGGGQFDPPGDPTNVDTGGDLNWENWDHLVRQFGMDMDPSGADGNATGWTGANWEMGTSGPNLRMGMGMGGGDWF